MTMLDETRLLYLACLAYAAGYAGILAGRGRLAFRIAVAGGTLGLLLHSLSLALRWQRVGHGPFINLYEILSSNLWSLQLAFLAFLLLAPASCSMGRLLVPLLGLMMLWLLVTEPRDSMLPATYHTIWLYFHVVSGKLFLGLLMLATGMAIYESIRDRGGAVPPPVRAADLPSYRLLAFAFCFESLMLLFGAIWAQDAWGRYWAWDPLETWAFLTWLGVLFVLHWRLGFGGRRVYAVLMAGCFVLAFLTFFGVPFVSTAPHKGMI